MDRELHVVMPFPSTTNTSKADATSAASPFLVIGRTIAILKSLATTPFGSGSAASLVAADERSPRDELGRDPKGSDCVFRLFCGVGWSPDDRALGSSASSGVAASSTACLVQLMFGLSACEAVLVAGVNSTGLHFNGVRGLNLCRHR